MYIGVLIMAGVLILAIVVGLYQLYQTLRADDRGEFNNKE